MERKLLKVIMNPAMIASWVFGLLMLHANPALMEQGWMHGKILLVVLLSGLHGFFAKTTKTFARDQNHRSGRFYRYINEIPAVFMILIVIFAVAEPF
jgi:putative membrane protein